MNAGRLKEPIQIERRENVVQSDSGAERTKTTLLGTRAEVRHDRGMRIEDNGEIVHQYDKTFIVWDYLRNYVSEYDRVLWRGKPYIITSLEHVAEAKLLYIKTVLANE